MDTVRRVLRLHGDAIPRHNAMERMIPDHQHRDALERLGRLNPSIQAGEEPGKRPRRKARAHRLQKVLVANRGEIAKRFFLALHEEGIPSAAVVTDPDRGQSWYEFADEVVFIGEHYNYSSIETIIAAARLIGANAVYCGYGFLSENAGFVEEVERISSVTPGGIIFMGPDHGTIRLVGNKVEAKKLAREHEIPLFESSEALDPSDMERARGEAARIGYPVILKPVSGGGGKGMYTVASEEGLQWAVHSCARIGRELYGSDQFYIEKYIDRPIHIEVQLFNGWAIGIRKCAVQRRNQKIIEESGHAFMDDYMSLSLLAAAEKMAHMSGYSRGSGAGTVEFLFNASTGRFGFLEMNTRLQVEYAVTDQSLGIDIVKWQILYFDGREGEILGLEALKKRIAERDHSIECRIYAEEPENDYLPSPGTILELDLPTFNGIRCDFGFGEGDTVLSMYDPLLGKIIAHGSTRNEALIRLERALQELYIKGIKTNIGQLLRIVRHPAFLRGDYDNNILNEHPDLTSADGAAGSGVPDTGRMKHVIFGAFTEYVRLMQKSVRDFMIVADIEGYIEAPMLPRVPTSYCVEYRGAEYRMEFLQVSLDGFYAYADGRYAGNIVIVSINDRSDDLLLHLGNSSYRLRVNRHGHLIDLKMKDGNNKLDYFRLKVGPEGARDDQETAAVLSPFQGSFVSLCRNDLKPGDTVKKGDPLFVLSSMKMETVITAPEDGEIVSLIEDGDVSRLVLGVTPDGRITGKSIQDGEVLLRIRKSTPAGGGVSVQCPPGAAAGAAPGGLFSERLLDRKGEFAEIRNPERHLKEIAALLNASAQGLIQDQMIVDSLKRVLKKITPKAARKVLDPPTMEVFERLILLFACVKKAFSPVLSEGGISYQEELNLHLERRGSGEFPLSQSFDEVMRHLRRAYGLDRWNGRADVKKMLPRFFFYLLRHSYRFCMDNGDLIQKSVQLLSLAAEPDERIKGTLMLLLEQEQAERDDTLFKYITRTFAGILPRGAAGKAGRLEGPVGGLRLLCLDFREANREILRERHAVTGPENTLTDAHTPGDMPEMEERLSILTRRHAVYRLFSPLMNVEVARIVPKNENGTTHLVAFTRAYFKSEKDRCDDLKSLLSDARWPLELHRRPDERCWIEVFTHGMKLDCDECPPRTGGVVTLRDLRSACGPALRDQGDGMEPGAIMHIPVIHPGGREEKKPIVIHGGDGSVSLEFLQETDRGTPYCSETKPNIVNQRLFKLRKWPIEIWASQCFDSGVMRELQIRRVDFEREGLGLETKPAVRPVGAKIYLGEIGGTKALFYMKDSRISGGSTGNWEGLKYAAACYLAYMKDWPLYLWNDSAGANIMEGVVSLNRGAEGFMMNTLLTSRAGIDDFSRFLGGIEDICLHKILDSVRADFGLDPATAAGPRRSFQLTAIGIGPSAGLDVYGSSQASIQVMLDSEQTYRVLTGSSVIRAVIGEDISNYDIGGAKILGKWTGIVDLIARDKLHLISMVRRIHSLFTTESPASRIDRVPFPHRKSGSHEKGTTGFSEQVIREHVDGGIFLPFKEDYYASSACIGGFAKIAGRRVLIIGTRTDRGLKSPSSIIKARELLRAAFRTGSHQIIISGKRLVQKPDLHENAGMRPHIDLMDALRKKAGIRINIITDPEGFKSADILGAADALIYIRPKQETPDGKALARKNATFIVSSTAEAFDLAAALIGLIDPAGEAWRCGDGPGGIPRIPADSGTPYEIIESVILPVFDAGSFMEFFGDMNDPVSGPNLITGMARLEGRAVGIIADQPLLKGGGADAMGTEKFRVFTAFLNRNSIPLVMLSNSSGFVPGSSQERQRIQAIGAESLDCNITGRMPVVSVVLKQNYGGRLIHAFNKFLRPGIVYLALETSILAVIGVEAAFELLFGSKYQRMILEGKREEAASLKREFTEEYLEKARSANDAVQTGLVDWTIPDIRNLRENLVRGMDLAIERCRRAFAERPE